MQRVGDGTIGTIRAKGTSINLLRGRISRRSKKGASKNRRERVKLAVTGLANTGHVPSVRRAPELTDSPARDGF